MRRMRIILACLGLTLGLVALLFSTGPAVAQPVQVTPLPPVTHTDGRAGADYSFYPDPQTGQGRPFLPLAVNAGSRWDRFDFSWPKLEPADNSWSSDVLDGYDTLVNDLHDAGIVNIVGILQMTPQWAATQCALGRNLMALQQSGDWYPPVPRTSLVAPNGMPHVVAPQDTWNDWWVRTPPSGLYNSWTVGNFNDNQWAEFVYTIVSRYRDQVKYWEMWNEAEWNLFWCGSERDYAQLLKVGYQATKAACPDCTVLFAGLHYWADPTFFERVLDIINDDPTAPTSNYFFDAMSVHLYSRSSTTYDVVHAIRNRMKAYVSDHPIWLTETGVPVWGDPQAYNLKYDYAATQDEAAAYVIQSYANAWASGVERYFFFRVNDADMGEYFGLMRNDRSLRPAYVAYQVATTYLISPTFVTRVPTGPHVRVTLWGTPRGKVSVLWNTGPTAGVYTLAAARPTATVVYSQGVTQTIAATAGIYTFTLPGATANLVDDPGDPYDSNDPNDYIIGGDPLIVIESETVNQPPTSTVWPLPPVTLTPVFTVTWEGWDDESGVWLYDVQVRDGNGEWVLWTHSVTETAGQYTGVHDHTYSFRSRAADRVGNRGDWSAPVTTTLDLSSTLRLTVGPFFADENRNGVWDEPGEITLTNASLRFLDGMGHDVVSPTVGNMWAFTTTILAGETYRLHITATTALTDYIRILPFTWPQGREVYTETWVLGLWPARRAYLPLVLRQ